MGESGIERTRRFLEGMGLPAGDRHDLPSSTQRFADGGQWRVEIPSVEGPNALRAVFETADELGVPVHRVSQGSGVMLLTDAAALRCDKTHGTEPSHSSVVKVFKVKQGKNFRFYGCARPRGPVVALTQRFTGNQVKLVAAKAAYVAFTRVIRGSDTIAVVDARTGRKRHGLFPPGGIEFDIDRATPQIGIARINETGELVVAYVGLGDGSSRDSMIHLYAFDRVGHQQLLDRGPSSKLLMKSVRLNGENVTWLHDGVTRTARVGSVPLSVTTGSGTASGTVTTEPDVGIACGIGPAGVSGSCIGSFDPQAMVSVHAIAAANTRVTIRGACNATYVPVTANLPASASCVVNMSGPQSVEVTFG